MGVTCRCLDLSVAKEFANHGKAQALRHGIGRERVAQVVNADVIDTRLVANTLPKLLDFLSVGAWNFAADYPRVIRLPFEVDK